MDKPRSVAKANYIAEIKNVEMCKNCGTCETICIFKAIPFNENGSAIQNWKGNGLTFL